VSNSRLYSCFCRWAVLLVGVLVLADFLCRCRDVPPVDGLRLGAVFRYRNVANGQETGSPRCLYTENFTGLRALRASGETFLLCLQLAAMLVLTVLHSKQGLL